MTSKEIVTNWFAHIDNKNFDGVRSLMADNHEFHNPMTPEPLNADGHIGMMQMMTAAFEGQHHLDITVEEKEYVAVKGRWTGTHVGEFEGIPATGKDIEFSFSDLFRIQDGKVGYEHMELNPMSIMAQLGAMEGQSA